MNLLLKIGLVLAFFALIYMLGRAAGAATLEILPRSALMIHSANGAIIEVDANGCEATVSSNSVRLSRAGQLITVITNLNLSSSRFVGIGRLFETSPITLNNDSGVVTLETKELRAVPGTNSLNFYRARQLVAIITNFNAQTLRTNLWRDMAEVDDPAQYPVRPIEGDLIRVGEKSYKLFTGEKWVPVVTATNEPPVWERPRMAELQLSWPPNPDAAHYRIEYRSTRTTNRWVRADLIPSSGDANTEVYHSIVVDASVPIWTRVIGIGENGSETAPSNAVRHPAVIPPRPMQHHRGLGVRELTTPPPHRARILPMPVYPEPPIPQ